MSNKWTINKKLWLLCGCLMFNIFLVGMIGFWNTNTLKKNIDDLSVNQINITRNIFRIRSWVLGIRGEVLNVAFGAQSKDSKSIDTGKAGVSDYTKKLEETIALLEKASTNKDYLDTLGSFKAEASSYSKAASDAVTAIAAAKPEEVAAPVKAFNDKFDSIYKYNDKLRDLAVAQVSKATDSAAAEAFNAKTIMSVVVAISILLGFFNAWWVIRGLSNSLNRVIQELSQNSRSVADVATGMKTNAQSLASSTNSQASALQETAASFDEISAMIKKTGENSHRLEECAKSSQKTAGQGKTSISGMLSAIDQIRDSNAAIMHQIEESNTKITGIVKVIGEIGSKTKVINDIVFQTKLLSFNASVEAARAGEHGKGFAVVAEEVGSLAQMSGNAAKEISDLLSSSIQTVESIVRENKDKVEILISEGKEKIELGVSVAEQCGTALNEIVKQSEEVGSMVGEITTAIREQSQGVQEIAKAINLLDKSTNEITTNSGATSRTSETLLTQAHSLNAIVNSLEVMTIGTTIDHGIGNGKLESASNVGSALGNLGIATKSAPSSSSASKSKEGTGKVVSLDKKREELKTSPVDSKGKTTTPGQKAPAKEVATVELKKAAGAENISVPKHSIAGGAPNASQSTPKKDDPRFEEV